MRETLVTGKCCDVRCLPVVVVARCSCGGQVHVFETVIRVLGGMLSAHTLLVRDPSLVPGYDDIFLTRSVDLARRLLPAFNTPTGIPMMYLNLQSVGRLSRLGFVSINVWNGCVAGVALTLVLRGGFESS